MIIIELLATVCFYYLGYICYCNGKSGYTMLFVLACAMLACLFFRRLTGGTYVNMSLRRLDKLSGKAFEKYLSVQFRRLGYRVKDTGDSHDYGADLILRKHGKCIVVQAKRYDRNIGISAIQEAVGAIAYYEADRAMVVTNRYFTKSAINLARQNEVELWNRDDLIRKFKVRR